jgi:hypothetical protein
MKSKIVIAVIFLVTSISLAQFEASKSYLGPSIGFSFNGSVPQFGANYEYGMSLKEIGLSGSGKIGIGGIIRYWRYSEDFSLGKWSYTNILIGAQGNFHFQTSGKLDPWIGLVLAYNGGSVSWDGPESKYLNEPSHGGLWLGGHAGIRYFLSPTLALSVHLGFGTLSYGALDVGIDLRL